MRFIIITIIIINIDLILSGITPGGSWIMIHLKITLRCEISTQRNDKSIRIDWGSIVFILLLSWLKIDKILHFDWVIILQGIGGTTPLCIV